MDQQNQNPNQLNIEISEEVAEGSYANNKPGREWL